MVWISKIVRLLFPMQYDSLPQGGVSLRFKDVVKPSLGIIILLLIPVTSTYAKSDAGEFMLGVNSRDSTLSVYRLGTQGVVHTQGFYPTAKNPKAVAVHPSGKFAYVVAKTANSIMSYEIVHAGGRLELRNPNPYPVAAVSPFALVIHPTGRFLYVAAREGKIAAFRINTQNGSLTPVKASPFVSQARTRSLVIHPSGRFLYAVNAYANSISAYRIDNQSGALTPLPGSPFTVLTGEVKIRSLWQLADVAPGAGGIPYYVALEPQGRFLYVSNWGAGKIAGFAIDQETGALSPLPGSPYATGLNPYALAVHPSGRFLYAGSWQTDSLWAYRIDPQTGALQALAQKSFITGGSAPVSIQFNASGEMAYVANGESASISSFKVNRQTGELGLLQTTQTRPGPWWLGRPVERASASSGTLIYTLNKKTRQLSVWQAKLARISHHAPTAAADASDLMGRSPSSRLDVVSTTPSPSSGPSTPSDQRLDALATMRGEKCGLEGKGEAKRLDSVALPSGLWAVQDRLSVVYAAQVVGKSIAAYQLDKSNRHFVRVAGMPWQLPGTPVDLKIDINGWYLYVLTKEPNLLLAFGIHSETASLVAVARPVALRSTPAELLLDPAARFAYVFSADRRQVSLFSYRQNTGPLLYERTRFGSPFTLKANTLAPVIDHGANFLSLPQSNRQAVSVYRIDPLSGALGKVADSPFQVGTNLTKLAMHPDGNFVYVLDEAAAKLFVYKRHALNGKIDQKPDSLLDLANRKISAFTVQGDFLYLTDALSKSLLVYALESGRIERSARLKLHVDADSVFITSAH